MIKAGLVGSVGALWRYPVKSMMGERVETVAASFRSTYPPLKTADAIILRQCNFVKLDFSCGSPLLVSSLRVRAES
jgi:hypothetical protein